MHTFIRLVQAMLNKQGVVVWTKHIRSRGRIAPAKPDAKCERHRLPGRRHHAHERSHARHLLLQTQLHTERPSGWPHWRKPSLAALFDKLTRPTHAWYNRFEVPPGEAPDALHVRDAKPPPPPPHDVQQADSKAGWHIYPTISSVMRRRRRIRTPRHGADAARQTTQGRAFDLRWQLQEGGTHCRSRPECSGGRPGRTLSRPCRQRTKGDEGFVQASAPRSSERLRGLLNRAIGRRRQTAQLSAQHEQRGRGDVRWARHACNERSTRMNDTYKLHDDGKSRSRRGG